MSGKNNSVNAQKLARLLAQPGPLRLTPGRLRWSLGFLAHVAFIALGWLAYRDGYMESPMGVLGMVLVTLSLPLTLMHALTWRCFIEVNHEGIHQVIMGWRRFYAWHDVSTFSLRRVQRKTYVIFQHRKADGKVRECGLGLTYGMKPALLAEYLRLKQLMLRAAADPKSTAA